MIRVVVTGSECTGKTTLATALAEHYEAPWVPEYARHFVAEKGAAPEFGDLETIARGQIELEDSVDPSTRLVIQDTDLLSTLVYGRHYWGEVPRWIEEAVEKRSADLYLLADIDVPWSPDGALRDRGHRRDEMQALFRSALEQRRLPWVGISGDRTRRLYTALASIDRLIAR